MRDKAFPVGFSRPQNFIEGQGISSLKFKTCKRFKNVPHLYKVVAQGDAFAKELRELLYDVSLEGARKFIPEACAINTTIVLIYLRTGAACKKKMEPWTLCSCISGLKLDRQFLLCHKTAAIYNKHLEAERG
eukprot:258467-Pelagomonas_calceolata.AAC.1